MTSGLDGKAALIVGGSRGIGAEVARRFALAGAKVAIGYRAATDEANKLVAELRKGGVEATAIAGNIAVPTEAEAIVRGAYDTFDRLDILVNTAGVSPYLPLEQIDPEHIRTVLDVNVLGAIMLTKAAAPLLPSPGGRIIHFSSRLAYNPIPTSSVYSASKAAVATLVHAYARELGPRGITVNAVAPGVIETDMTTEIIQKRGDQVRAATPLGRIGQPSDIAGLVEFLASPDSGWITGRTIIADGGLN